MLPEIWSVTDTNNPKNQNFEKMQKTPGYHHFTQKH